MIYISGTKQGRYLKDKISKLQTAVKKEEEDEKEEKEEKEEDEEKGEK